MQRGIVQKIFNDHFAEYEKQNKLHARERYAAWSIMTCRTHEQGYHINACPNGDFSAIFNNSCKHRGCPQCGATDTERWLERRKAQALDCPYFHIVFTISHALHIIWRFNRKLFTGLMMRAAWRSLRELVLDWKYLGGLPGAVAVFQSWDDEMREHCHLHFIVTAGGLNDDGRWVCANDDFLLPTPVLAAKFRGKFLAYLKKALCKRTNIGVEKDKSQLLCLPYGMGRQKCLNLINKLGRKRWHADIEPAYKHANGVFKYVGRYIRRGPISERRIIGYDGQIVIIGYAHSEKHENSYFKLPANRFIARLLCHVPEKGTHIVRSYGLFHPRCRPKLNLARRHLGQGSYVPALQVPDAIEILAQMFPEQKIGRCPICSQRLRTVFIYRGGQAPRWKLAA
jgi:ssDNA-binding Zn-finger/Zn-ribbon topoisomerase 1